MNNVHVCIQGYNQRQLFKHALIDMIEILRSIADDKISRYRLMVESKVKSWNNLVIEKHRYTSHGLLIICFIENCIMALYIIMAIVYRFIKHSRSHLNQLILKISFSPFSVGFSCGLDLVCRLFLQAITIEGL